MRQATRPRSRFALLTGLVAGLAIASSSPWAEVAPSAAPMAGHVGNRAENAKSSGDSSCSTPVGVVETLHGTLMESMKQGEALDFQGRFDLIVPVVDLTFDIELMGAKSVGRHWKALDATDQALWVRKFGNFIAASFAGNFKSYDGEKFETLGDEPAARETRVVLTKLHVPKSDDVVFNYRVKEYDGSWQIIDIYLKGTVSELALRRSDFSTTLKNDGFLELSAAIDRKIEELREEADG